MKHKNWGFGNDLENKSKDFDYGFGRNPLTEDDKDWMSTKSKPVPAKMYPYDHMDDLIYEKVKQHIDRTDNPHNVTLQQLNADKLFTHNIQVIQSEDKTILTLVLLDLNGNPIENVGPIDINLAEYTEEQLEELKEFLEREIENVSDSIIELLESKIAEVNQRIDDLAPDLNVNEDDTTDSLILEDNAETVYKLNLTRLNLIIPETVKHGYCSSVTFTIQSTLPQISFINNSTFNLVLIQSNEKVTELELNPNCQYNCICICNGLQIEFYVQEIALA